MLVSNSVIKNKFLLFWLAEPCPSLKVNIYIPKDSSKPDGDAIENGVLLSTSELHKCGHFINFPTNEMPILGAKTKNIDNDPKDKSYWLLKHSNTLDDKAPECIYSSDREEVISVTEFGCMLIGGTVENLKDEWPILTLISEKKKKINESARLITNWKDNHQKRRLQPTRVYVVPNRKSMTMMHVLI